MTASAPPPRGLSAGQAGRGPSAGQAGRGAEAGAGHEHSVAPQRIYSDHLVALCTRAATAAAEIGAAAPHLRAQVAATARSRGALLSARLDGSPITDVTAAAVAGGIFAPETPGASTLAAPPVGGWAGALKLDGMPTQDIAAVEYANLLACLDAIPELARRVFADPRAVLERLHGLIAAGLVAPTAIGRPRVTVQAVMDGGQGRVLYNPPDPGLLPARLAALTAWLAGPSYRLPAVVVAGVVHERILQWQPFEAANGRVARAAARVVLHARGLPAVCVAVVEEALAADPLGYHAEIAASMRRRGDLRVWLERWGEAVAAGLEAAAVAAGRHEAYPPPSEAARAVVARLRPGETVTVAEHARMRGLTLPAAYADLLTLTVGGLLAQDTGTRGQRFLRV